MIPCLSFATARDYKKPCSLSAFIFFWHSLVVCVLPAFLFPNRSTHTSNLPLTFIPLLSAFFLDISLYISFLPASYCSLDLLGLVIIPQSKFPLPKPPIFIDCFLVHFNKKYCGPARRPDCSSLSFAAASISFYSGLPFTWLTYILSPNQAWLQMSALSPHQVPYYVEFSRQLRSHIA